MKTQQTKIPTDFASGTKVRDIYTGEVKTVHDSQWQFYAGGDTSDYTITFREGGWNKSTNLEPAPAQPKPGPRWEAIREDKELIEKALAYQKQATLDARAHAQRLADALMEVEHLLDCGNRDESHLDDALGAAREALAVWNKEDKESPADADAIEALDQLEQAQDE